MPAVSSTEVRRRIDAGEDASGLVSRSVLGYIDRRGLYR
jgi:nicotinic acid mononucleotide adenylyltransferase